jgi:hypothetical protein
MQLLSESTDFPSLSLSIRTRLFVLPFLFLPLFRSRLIPKAAYRRQVPWPGILDERTVGSDTNGARPRARPESATRRRGSPARGPDELLPICTVSCSQPTRTLRSSSRLHGSRPSSSQSTS